MPPQEGSAGAAASASLERSEVRPDIQALRALAVLSVLAFHLRPGSLSGGYIGVDVFFVISGFLITLHLLAEIDSTGQVGPGRFWARRLKRLQPAALLVLFASSLAVFSLVPRRLWDQFFQDILASTVEMQNWLLAHNAVDYFNATNPPSPTQHFWTLSVEEQFYVGLPLLLLAAVHIARLRGSSARRATLFVLGFTAALSLAYCVFQTSNAPSNAYFSTFCRAWEFATGGLLAHSRHGLQRRAATTITGLAGVVAIVASSVLFSSSTPYPGLHAAIPVLGTAVCIQARSNSLSVLGRFRPIALIGRTSYSIYLWHWPILILFPYVTGRDRSIADDVMIAIGSIALAWMTTAFVEDPVRFSPRLLGGARSPRTVALTCAIGILVVAGIADGAMLATPSTDSSALAMATRLADAQPACFGAQAMDPEFAPCENPALAGVLVPDPAIASADVEPVGACWDMADSDTANVCSLRPSHGSATKKLYALGDSHSTALLGMYRRMARINNWQIDVSGGPGCYVTTAEQQQPTHKRAELCRAWRRSVVARANHGGYDAFIVTHSSSTQPVLPAQGQSVNEATVAGLIAAWREFPPVPIIAIRDNPAMLEGTLLCVELHKKNPENRCTVPRSKALQFDGQAEAAAAVPNARYLDLTWLYCTNEMCPPVIGHVLVYRDRTHLSATFASTLTPYVEGTIRSAFKS